MIRNIVDRSFRFIGHPRGAHSCLLSAPVEQKELFNLESFWSIAIPGGKTMREKRDSKAQTRRFVLSSVARSATRSYWVRRAEHDEVHAKYQAHVRRTTSGFDDKS